MILEVNKRHKSEGETIGSRRKISRCSKCQRQHRMHEEGEIKDYGRK